MRGDKVMCPGSIESSLMSTTGTQISDHKNHNSMT